jgi:eukaryotic-like serine/threonine-protein kinase
MSGFQPQLDSSISGKSDLTGKNIGRFVVRRRLGAGGMGEVYLAYDSTLKREIALKRLTSGSADSREERQRLIKEAERASGVAGAHLAAIYDVVEHHGEIFLAMEYVNGQTLRQLLSKPMSIPEFLSIATQCAEALVSAQQKGIVHCDLKPENIMITGNGTVKVLDFGVAKHIPSSDQSSTLDQGTAGTPAYMAPEMLLQKGVDGRSDIFSLGVVFYEMLAGAHPFRDASYAGTIDGVLRREPAPLSRQRKDIPGALEALVLRMLAKKPEDRPINARSLLTELSAIGKSPSVLAPAAGKRVWVWQLWPVLAVVIIFFVGFHYREQIHNAFIGGEPGEKHLAVLPFAPATNDANGRAFSNGLTEVLTTKLSQLSLRHPVFVVPSSEVRDEAVSTVEQARRGLGVNLVLEGSLAESGGNMRVAYVLVDAVRRRQIRGDVITVQADDPFRVEDEVVQNVMNALDVELGGEDRAWLSQHGTTTSVAYDYYLRGRGYLQEWEQPGNLDNAIVVFQHALEEDHQYASAFAGLGQAYWLQYEHTQDRAWIDKADAACQQAERFGDALADTHVCLGTVLKGTGKYEVARDEFLKASEIDPANDDAVRNLAECYQELGKPELAEATYRHAIDLRPQYWMGYNRLGIFYFSRARYQDAMNQFEQVIRLVPDGYRGYSNLGVAFLAMGRYADAIPQFTRSAQIRPTAFAYSNLGTAYFYQKRYQDAATTYEQAIHLEESSYDVWGNLAEAYYWMPGQRQKSLETYRKAISLGEDQLRVNPKASDVLANLALYLAMLGDRISALQYLNRATDIAPKDPTVLYTAAKAYMQLGSTNQALAYLRRSTAAGYSTYWPKDDPEFGSMSSDPKFLAIFPSRQ